VATILISTPKSSGACPPVLPWIYYAHESVWCERTCARSNRTNERLLERLFGTNRRWRVQRQRLENNCLVVPFCAVGMRCHLRYISNLPEFEVTTQSAEWITELNTDRVHPRAGLRWAQNPRPPPTPDAQFFPAENPPKNSAKQTREPYLVSRKKQVGNIRISPNSTWLVTSRLDTTRHVRRVEPMHFGCVKLVEQHGSTRSSLRARHVRRVERVVWSCRDVTWRAKWNLGYIRMQLVKLSAQRTETETKRFQNCFETVFTPFCFSFIYPEVWLNQKGENIVDCRSQNVYK